MAVQAPTEEGQRPVSDSQSNQSLPRAEVLRRKADFARVARRGRRVPGPNLCLTAAESTTDAPGRRIAFLLGRGISSAVDRNLLKRRLREVYRLNKNWFPAGFDYTVRASATAAGLSCSSLSAEVHTLARRFAGAR